MSSTILDRLPSVRGTIEPMVDMGRYTWFGVGGAAMVMFTPSDGEDLLEFLKATPKDIPILPIGAGSNLLVRDGGIDGVVINSGALTSIEQEGDYLVVGAGLRDAEVARSAAKLGLGGLEFLVGIPGTIGGGLRMNAGAYGSEFKDIVAKAEVIDRNATIHQVTPEEMGMGYRHSDAPSDWIFTRAWLKVEPNDESTIRSKMKEIISSRASAQPTAVRTGGSTFANPEGKKAWQLIDAAGCRGLKVGKAEVSDKHCNFLINTGGATASELEELGETIRQRVNAHSGVDLRWEIKRVGSKKEVAA